MIRRIWALVAIALLLTPLAVAKSQSRTVVDKFIKACEAGNENAALALCDYQIGNGRSMVEPGPIVTKFVGFMKTRTLVYDSEYPAGVKDIVQLRYKCKEDGSTVIFNTKPLKGGKWFVAGVNLSN